MNSKFVFDVDGTLTPSRCGMDATFQRWFLEFCYSKEVYLVTGSDYPKTVEQLGTDIVKSVRRIYNCNGNDIWEGGVNIRSNEWTLPEDVHEWLSEQLTASAFPTRTGLHFEHRPGMVNFSIVGRNANQEQRNQYVEWDKEHDERVYIAHNFNLIFPELDAKVGGETGLDIAPKGADKSQILKDFGKYDFIYFYGDAMHPGGNDFPLKQSILDSNAGLSYHVSNWKETWENLREHFSNGS